MPQCKECGTEIKYPGICIRCRKLLANRGSMTQTICCSCQDPSVKAREFTFHSTNGKFYKQTWCFDCWEANSSKGISSITKTYGNKYELEYARSILEYIRKPSFYGEDVNLIAVEQAYARLQAEILNGQ